MRYLHTMLRVRNLDTAMKFYQDALGLKEVRRIDNDKGRFTLVFLCAPEDEGLFKAAPQNRGAPLVELTYNWDEEKYGEDRHFGHLAYEVDDIYATCDRLMKAGITINRPPRDGNMAFVRSPDLHSIELLQKGEPKPPAERWPSWPNTAQCLASRLFLPRRVNAMGGWRPAAVRTTSTPRCARRSTAKLFAVSDRIVARGNSDVIKRSFAPASFPRRNRPRHRAFSPRYILRRK